MSRPDSGSVLVETLVATAVMAVVLTGFFEVIGSSVTRSGRIESRRTALLIARSQLDAAGADGGLVPGVLQGDEQGLTWRVAVSPCDDDHDSTAGHLYCLTATVAPPSGGPALVTLTTRRLSVGG